MKTTENYGFNLFEGQDKLSMSKINENTEKMAGLLIKGARVEAGSYVGTGLGGKDNPNTLTFDFEPKFVIITFEGAKPILTTTLNDGYQTEYAYYGGSRLELISGIEAMPGMVATKNAEWSAELGKVVYSYSRETTNLVVQFNGKSVSWYVDHEDSYGSSEYGIYTPDAEATAPYQNNAADKTYHYIAIGQAAEEDEG